MNLNDAITAFISLNQYFNTNNSNFIKLLPKAKNANAWFTHESLIAASNSICENILNESALKEWANSNNVVFSNKLKTIGVVTNDKTPFASLKDILSILLSGHNVKIKSNESDDVYYKYLFNALNEISPAFQSRIEVHPILKDVDAYILNGLNESETLLKYFKQKPCLIRHRTSSVGILTGLEIQRELDLLATAICTNFGRDSYNISKLIVPNLWDPKPLLKCIEENYDDIKHHHKYKNNYDYQLSLLLVNGVEHFATENILLRESRELFSPVSCLFYEQYVSQKEILDIIEKHSSSIQNIYAKPTSEIADSKPFDSNYNYGLNSYPSNLNTLDFLSTLQ